MVYNPLLSTQPESVATAMGGNLLQSKVCPKGPGWLSLTKIIMLSALNVNAIKVASKVKFSSADTICIAESAFLKDYSMVPP